MATETHAPLAPPSPPPRLHHPGAFHVSRRLALFVYVAMVSLAAVEVAFIGVMRWLTPTRDDLLRGGLLLILFVFANWQPRHLRPHTKLTLDDVPLFAATLLLPLPLAVAVVLLGKIPLQVQMRVQQRRAKRQQPWFVMVFNSAVAVLLVGVGKATLAVFRPAAPFNPEHLGAYLLALAAMAVSIYATNVLLLAGAVGLQRRINPFARWWHENWRTLVDRTTLFALGAVGATLSAVRWWELAFVILPMISLFVSVGNAARAYLWQEAATRDPLTALYNRLYFFERFAQAERRAMEQGEPCGLIVMDLDRLKQYNDTHGHIVGDQALIHAADFLRDRSRARDIVARIGGDEFAILLPQTTATEVERVAARIRAALPIVWSEHAYPPLSFSIGVAHIFDPAGEIAADRVRTIQHVMHEADVALYAEKHLHKQER